MTSETQTPAIESPNTNFLLGEDAIVDEIRVVQSFQNQRNMPVLLFGNLLAVTIIFYVDWAATVSSHAVYFLVAVVVLLLPMLRSYLKLRTRPRPEKVSKRRIRLLEIYSLLLGLVWAIAIFLDLLAVRPIDGVIISLVMLYVCFGSVALMPSLPRASASYVVPIFLGTFVGLFINNILSVDLLILLFFAGIFSLGRAAWQSWQDTTASVRLGLEKLRAEAEIHRRETEAMHSMLEKEAQLRLVMDNMPGGIRLVDKDRNYVFFNQQYLDLYNFPNDLLKVGGSNRVENLHQAERGDFGPGDPKALMEARRDELPVHTEQTIWERTTIFGRTLQVRTSPTPDGGVVNIVTDITESKRAEALLRESEQQLKDVLESSPIGVSITNSKSERVIVNQRYADLVGMPRDELLGGRTQNVWTRKEDRENYARQFDENKRVVDMEFEMQRADGTTIWVLANAITLAFSAEEVRVNWIVDLTERKRAELEINNLYSIIRESIDYASNIQRAALPLDNLMADAFEDHFVIWEPRDVVGGDIYWLVPVPNGFVLGVADCTGHGVPGAFVTLLASGALRHAITQYPDGSPADLIASMNRFIKEVLSQYTEDSVSDDGLEIGICRIDQFNRTMTYAGARFSLWESRNGAMREFRGDKTGIGYKDAPITLELTNHELKNRDDTSYYLFSDGFTDQVGGAKGRGLGKRRVLDCLLEHQNEAFSDQAKQIMLMFREHQGNEIRRDDLTMIGFKL